MRRSSVGTSPLPTAVEIENELNIHVRPLSWPISNGPTFRGVYNIYEEKLNLFSGEDKQNIEESIELKDVNSPDLESYIGEQYANTLREELEETCKKYNISDRVIFLGMIPNKDLFGYLSLSDALVFPHRYFNYEWALLEAMCTEKPIIATDMPATSDILKNGYTALLAEPTVGSLSMKMQEILENPKLAKKIAKNALETVREKHGYGNLRKYEELIHSL